MDKDQVLDLADTPSKEVLLGKLVGSLMSPLYNFAYGIRAIIDKDGCAEEAPAAAEEAPAAE